MVNCQSSNEIKIQIQKFIKKMNLLTLHHLAIHLTFAGCRRQGFWHLALIRRSSNFNK